MTVADVRLGPLVDNGGATLTHALLPGSPALDTGNPDPPGGAGACAATDQRGRLRPVGPRCDIGAWEGACGNGREGFSAVACVPGCRCALEPRPDQVTRAVVAATQAPGAGACRRRLRAARTRAAALGQRLGRLTDSGCLRPTETAARLAAIATDAADRARALARSGYCAAR